MVIDNVIVVRCQLCQKLVGRDSYLFPWETIESGNKTHNFVCQSCDVVMNRLFKAGWFKEWYPIQGKIPVHIILSRGFLSFQEGAKCSPRWVDWDGPLDSYTDRRGPWSGSGD